MNEKYRFYRRSARAVLLFQTVATMKNSAENFLGKSEQAYESLKTVNLNFLKIGIWNGVSAGACCKMLQHLMNNLHVLEGEKYSCYV
jgi:hypothetical protein